MSTPLVSVIIPAYNASHTLPATVKSALAQTMRDLEIVIINDGSRDNTLQVAHDLAATDSRIRVLDQQNTGVAQARNNAVEAAQGKYIAFLDSDDLWISSKLEKQLAVVENGQGIYAVQSGAYFVDGELNLLDVRPCFRPRDVLLETLLFQNLPNLMSSLLIHRGKFLEIGGFDTKLEILEDWELAIRLARYCNLSVLEEPMSLYRVHAGNRSRDLSIHLKPGFLVLDRLFKDSTLPKHIQAKRQLVYAHFYTMLSGGALRIGHWGECSYWARKALRSHPAAVSYIAALPLRRVQRRLSRLQPAHLSQYEAALRV